MAADEHYLPFGESVVSWREVTYAKIGNLGSGGTSDVYLALATSGPHKGIAFAVKVFKALSKEGWRVNFMREVHVLRDCDHPAIMKVIDEGIYRDQHPFVVMKYLPETLSKAMRGPTIPDDRKLSIVMQLLSALNYLSRRDPPVVHRDIKPSNVFLDSGACVLGDFGLILQVYEPRQRDAVEQGSGFAPEMARYYRTPELVSYHNGGPRPPPKSDVFQLGLVATELFTGKKPISDNTPEKPIRMEPIGEIPGPLNTPVRHLLEQMLIQDTDQRPSASDLLGSWQEYYLAHRKRQNAEIRAAKLQKS